MKSLLLHSLTARVKARHRALRSVCHLLLCLLACSTAQGSTAASQPSKASAVDSVPSWIDQAVFYEIFPRAFSAEGTLQGVTARLDDLARLGVNVLWLMPIHPTGKAHRLGTYGSVYAVRDYYAIDPALGTSADLQQLVDAAHQRHMRVILDEVPDHTAWDSVLMAHPTFYKHDAAGHIISPHNWTDVAALDYTNPALRSYMIAMYTYWLKTFHLDGFRCDDAGDVPVGFWNEASIALHNEKQDVLLLAEASQPDLLQGAFSLDYAWPLLQTLNQVITHGDAATAVRATMEAQQARFPKGSWHMLISDDHDTRRAVVRYGAEGALAASALVFTLPGAPMLYNGMEVGDATPSSGPALFEKVPIFWQSTQIESSFPRFYRVMLPLRTSSTALRRGELIWLHNSSEAHVVTFLRQSAEETLLIAVNLSTTPFTGVVESPAAAWKEIDLGTAEPQAEAGMPSGAAPVHLPPAALPSLSLPPFGVRIFRLPQP